MIRRTSVIVMMLVCLVLSGIAYAQIVTGTILGTVTDQSAAVLPGVTATITSPALPGGPSTTVTDEQGRYRFAGLDPGTYTLTLTLTGFGDYTEELRVITGGTIERNVSLKVGTVAETITVSGQSPMVDTRSAAVTSTSTREVIENLPTIRTTTTDFVQATPGVAQSNPGAYNEQIQVLGSPSNETTYVHDGTVINHVRTGNTWHGGDIDATEEIQTTALGASAEWLSVAGGVVNVVTKSGTNSFRGDATAYWKPNELQSRPTLVDCGCPLGETGFNLGEMKDYTAHAGGPIIRDKLWYFAGFQIYAFNYAEPGSNPDEQPTSYWNRFPIKVTWQMNESTKFSQSFGPEWWGGYSSGPTLSTTLEASAEYKEAHIHTWGSELNKTFGGATVLTVRGGGWWDPSELYGSVIGNFDAPVHEDLLTGLVSQGTYDNQRRIMRRSSQNAKLEHYISGARTQQNVRFGVQLEQAHATQQTAYPSGVQYYDFGGAPSYALFSAPSVRGAGFSTAGVWAEDQLTIGDRTTLTVGLRFDRMVGTSTDEDAVDTKLEKTGATVEGLGDMFTWNVWGPRVGFNYKLTSDGKTVLRSTYGRTYRQILLSEVDQLHPGISSITEAAYNPITRGYTDIVSVTNSTRNLALDGDLSAPKSDTYSIGVDRQLGAQLAVNTSFVAKRGENIIGWRDIGGVYGEGVAVLPDGRSLTVQRLLSGGSSRLFQLTNRPEYFDHYYGWVTSLTKRMANRWQGQLNLTISRSEGIRIPLTGNSGIIGRDPNDLTNAEGRLYPTDRPVMFTANGSYDIPRIDVRISAYYQNMSHTARPAFASVVLPQGRRNIYVEPPGFFRADRINLLYLRLNKIINFPNTRRIELVANIVNALQNQSPSNSFVTFNYFSSNYGVPAGWVQPRQLYVGARVNF